MRLCARNDALDLKRPTVCSEHFCIDDDEPAYFMKIALLETTGTTLRPLGEGAVLSQKLPSSILSR